jgi:prepilin-type N-terminal cleavage/methylation domain-containing protein
MKLIGHRGGYSLIEVIVASAIFLIAVLAVSGMLIQGYKAMGLAGKRSSNTHITQEELEAVISDMDYSPEDENVNISLQDTEVEVFGKNIGGTLVTVSRLVDGNEVIYTYFVPGYGGD